MRALISSSIIVFLCSIQFHVSAQASLNSYIDTALKNNPSLHVYKYRSEALQQGIKPSKAWDDPLLYVGVMNLPTDFSFTQDMMTMKQIGIQQNFSVGKKYAWRGAVAQKEYEASAYDEAAQKLSLIKQVKQQYYDLYAQTKAIEITEKSIEVMKSYIDIANTRYSTGQGTQQDVFKAQVELSKMQEELIKLQSMKGDMTAMFNALLNRNKMDSVQIPLEIKYQKINLLMDSLMRDADANSPMVLASKKMLGKDSATYMLAKTSKIPDFNTGLWYGQRQAMMPDGNKAPDMLGFTFGITLPVYSKQKQNPLIAESAINIQESQASVETTQNEVELMIHHGIIDALKNERLIVLYNTQLIPQATASLNAGITGYQENKIDFMTLVDNFLSLYNYQLEYYQAVADYYKAVAEIEMFTGRKLITQ
jgi:cobalt-zinc-cadmium efflux system outer membrane protein